MNQSIRDYLENSFTIPLRDPVWHHIYFSPGLLSVTRTPQFQQLSRIKQLGPSFLVYPGATHTRFNHSMGVFYLARRILQKLLTSPVCPDFTLEGGKAFLTAALVHDLGHFPFTHSLKELPLKEHETLTAEMVLSPPLAQVIQEEVGTDPQKVAAIVDPEIQSSDREVLFFRHILSGPLDPDKLDYLTRDAYFCGVPYGTQDIDYILSRIQPAPSGGLALEEQGISGLEHLLFSKYLMYRSVYWHRTVRLATGMIKKALHLALGQGIIGPNELYHLDDESFYSTLTSKKGFPAFRLIEDVQKGIVFSLAGETAFDPKNPHHQRLTNMTDRSWAESQLRKRIESELHTSLEEHELVLDIPEAVSFEIQMPILNKQGEELTYPAAKTVFTPRVVEDFTQTLRIIRLALPRPILDSYEKNHGPMDLRREIEELAFPVDLG